MTKIVIFRVPNSDAGEPLFAQTVLDVERGTISRDLKFFTVHPGDSYLNLTYSQIVVATFGDGVSKEHFRISITADGCDERPKIYEEGGYELLSILAPDLVKALGESDIK